MNPYQSASDLNLWLFSRGYRSLIQALRVLIQKFKKAKHTLHDRLKSECFENLCYFLY